MTIDFKKTGSIKDMNLGWFEILIFYVLPLSALGIFILYCVLLVLYPFLLHLSMTNSDYAFLWPRFLQPFFLFSCFVVILLVWNKVDNYLLKKKIELIRKLFYDKKYNEVLEIINNDKAFRVPVNLDKKIRLEVYGKYQVQSLAKTGKIEDAVYRLATELSANCDQDGFDKELLEDWYALYPSCELMDVKDFYFCSCCGLHPDTIKLFNLTIEKGFDPPKGFRNYYPGSSIVIDRKGVYKLFAKTKD